MPDLENIDLDLLDQVTGGCGGNSQPAPNPTPVTDTAAPSNRAAGFGFFGHVEKSHVEFLGPAHVGLGTLGGAGPTLGALDAAPAHTQVQATDDPVGSLVCGTVPGAAPASGAIGDHANVSLANDNLDVSTDFGDLHVDLSHGQVATSFLNQE